MQIRDRVINYFEGKDYEVPPLATSIRTSCYDKGRNVSVLTQLQMKNKIKFCRYNSPDFSGNILPYFPLVSIRVHNDGRLNTMPSCCYIPNLINKREFNSFKKFDFDRWWNEIIFDDKKGTLLSRRDVILNLADKLGGAHLDEKINKSIFELHESNSIGIKAFYNKEEKDCKYSPLDCMCVTIAIEFLESMKCYLLVQPKFYDIVKENRICVDNLPERPY